MVTIQVVKKNMAVESKKISYTKEEGCDFNTVLKKRVNFYFKKMNLSPKANPSMYIKSIFLMSIVVITYGVLLSNIVSGSAIFLLNIFLGISVAVGTMNISHDALHGAYVAKPFWNRALGFLMDVFGASSFYWKKEHTIDHHTYTNIAEHDSDLKVSALLRLCPKANFRPYHRFQYIYAPFLYCLNLLHWVYFSDIKRIYRIFKSPKSERPPFREIFFLLFFKIFHVCVFLALPIICLSLPWWMILLGYIVFLATVGLSLTLIFQLAHIVENVTFPLPNKDLKIENSFVKHQLATTSNFAMKSKLVCFLMGGLNFQVEHHIFPYICHIHLPKIASIVKDTATEFGLTYNENETLFSALKSHFRTLKKLGKKTSVENQIPIETQSSNSLT